MSSDILLFSPLLGRIWSYHWHFRAWRNHYFIWAHLTFIQVYNLHTFSTNFSRKKIDQICPSECVNLFFVDDMVLQFLKNISCWFITIFSYNQRRRKLYSWTIKWHTISFLFKLNCPVEVGESTSNMCTLLTIQLNNKMAHNFIFA